MSGGDRWDRRQLAALQRLDLLVDWTPAEIERRTAACDADAEQRSSQTGEDDPRDLDVGWLSEPLYRGLVEQARDRICDGHTSFEDVVALAARYGVVLAPDGGQSREGRHYAVIEAGGRVVRTAWAEVSRERDLARLAAAVCAAGGAVRSCFVRVLRDPRFSGSLYLRIAPAEVDPLVAAEIVIAMPDGEVDLISGGIASAATRTWYEARAVTRGAFAPALVALPLGGRWHIQGQLGPRLPGPVATNLLGTIAVVSGDRAVVASTKGAAVYLIRASGLSLREQGGIAMRPGDRLALGGRTIETVQPWLGPGALDDPDDVDLEDDELEEAAFLDGSARSDALLIVESVEL